MLFLMGVVVSFLVLTIGCVLFAGAENLSDRLLKVITAGDDVLLTMEDGNDNTSLQYLMAITCSIMPNLLARVGVLCIIRIVDLLESCSSRLRRPLWTFICWAAFLYVKVGAGLDLLISPQLQERTRRRLGRNLLYELVIAHKEM